MEIIDLIDKQRAFRGEECPFCGARDWIEDNGCTGDMLTFACNGQSGCGEQWDACDYALTANEHAALMSARNQGPHTATVSTHRLAYLDAEVTLCEHCAAVWNIAALGPVTRGARHGTCQGARERSSPAAVPNPQP